MGLERPEPGWTWFHPPLSGSTDVTVVSDVVSWWAHFYRPNGNKVVGVRCRRADGDSACAWCEREIGRRCRYVMAVRVPGGEIKLLELGRVQFPILEVLEETGGILGRRLRISRAFAKSNAEIVLSPIGREHVSSEARVQLEDFVSTLGERELRTHPAPPSPLSRSPR